MQLVLFGSYHQVLYVFGIEHQAGKQTSFLQLQNSLSLNDSCLGVWRWRRCTRRWLCWQWAQGGEACWWKEQLAKAESRFNIVTLTMYLIDISFL